jgi:hypothetical protein
MGMPIDVLDLKTKANIEYYPIFMPFSQDWHLHHRPPAKQIREEDIAVIGYFC